MEHLYLPRLGSAASALRIGVEKSSRSNLLQHKGSVSEEAWASIRVNEVFKGTDSLACPGPSLLFLSRVDVGGWEEATSPGVGWS